jgi:UDP-galactopyranose mutase
VLAYNYEPNSYIYMTHKTQTIVSTVKECLESQSFYLVGRFAEWKYYNMDNAIKAGMDLLEKLK